MNELKEKSLRKYYYGVLVVAAILTWKEVAAFINAFLVQDLKLVLIKRDISFFYSDQFNSLVYTSVGIVIGIFIPAYISLYGNAKSNNKIIQFFIRDNFKINDLLLIIVLLICGLISQNSLFILFLFFALVWFLYLKMKLYLNFLFKTKSTLNAYMKNAIRNAKSAAAGFPALVDEFEKVVNTNFTCKDDLTYLESRISFSSNEQVTRFSPFKLRNWLRGIEREFKDNGFMQTEASIELNFETNVDLVTSPKADSRISARIFYDSNTRYITTSFCFPSEEAGQTQFKAFRESVINKFSVPYSQGIFEYSEDGDETIEHLFSSLDVYIYTLLKQNQYTDFVEVLEMLKHVLRIEDFTNEMLIKMSFVNYRLFVIYNDFERNRATSFHFFEYWEEILNSTVKFKTKDSIYYALSDLSNAITHNIFREEELSDLDRTITSFYKMNKFDQDFIFNYLKGVVSIVISFASKHPLDFDKTRKLFDLIVFLHEDFSDEESYFFKEYPKEDIISIVRMTEEALVLCVFYLEQNAPQLQNKDYFFSKINSDTLLDVIQRVYLENERKWEVSWWRESKFNRHGHGGGSYSHSDFLLSGLVKYLELNHFNPALFSSSVITRNTIHFFTSLKARVEALELKQEVFLNQLNDFIKSGKIEEAKFIINSDINNDRLEKFVSGCSNSYLNERKFSNILPHNSRRDVLANKSIGFRNLIHKDSFIKEVNSSIDGLYEYGRNVAFAESRQIINTISDQVSPIDMTLKGFYKTTLIQNLPSNDSEILIFVGRSHHFYFSAFNWRTNKCVYNDNIEIVQGRSKEDNIQKFKYDSKEYEIHFIEADNLKSDFVIFCDKESMSLDYLLPTLEVDNLTYIRENNLYFQFKDYSKDESLVDEMIAKNLFTTNTTDPDDKKRELQQLMRFQLYITPNVNIIKPKKMKLFKIPRPKKESE
jgi:hypothetical protein